MKDIIFYGAGYNARLKYAQWVLQGLKPVCFADADIGKQHTLFKACGDLGGEEILPLGEAIVKYPNYEIYLTLMPRNAGTAFRYLLDEGIALDRIRFLETVTTADIASSWFLQMEKEGCICGFERGCPMPYAQPHVVSEGNDIIVYPCAPSDNPIPIGVYSGEKPFKDFLDSGYGKIVRSKVKNREYSDCPLVTCASKGRYIEAIEFMERWKAEYGSMPLIVKFMHDFECNLHCAMCRDELRTRDNEELEALNKKIDTIFLPMCKEADAVYFAGNGEPFASRHYRALITALAKQYPHLRFLIHTNGNLCSEKNFERLGITGRVESVLISLNAATRETYEKVSPGAHWDWVMDNIKWLMQCRGQGGIKDIFLSLVVQKANYMEMPKFVDFARRCGAKCRFTLCHHEPHSSISRCSDNEVFLPNHPDFDKYCKILSDPIFDWEGCYLDPYSKYLRQFCK